MATTLIHNLTSSYFTAAHKLYPKNVRKRIVAYVESYDDVAFWRALLEPFETDHYYFQVMLPSSVSLTKGKKMVLMNTLDTEALGTSMIACVDSDYDFLLQETTFTSRKLNHNHYIYQTYAYAIENYQCFAESLHEVCVQATLNDRNLFDFEVFMKQYSEVVYPLFLWNIYFYRQRDTHTFPMYELNNCTLLRDFSVSRPEKSLERVKRKVNVKLHELSQLYEDKTDEVKGLAEELSALGVTSETTYLYMQGHHIMNNVVLKILNPICTILRREREEEIKRLSEHDEQFRNELTCYQNSVASVEVMLRKNIAYKGLFLYQWLCEDLKKMLNK